VSADTVDENTEQATTELEPAEQDDAQDDAQAVQLHAPERGMLRIDPTQTELTARQRAALAAKGWPLDRMGAAHIDAMMHLCQVRGLDPYSGDIVPMVTQDGIVNIITIAALRRLAQATGEHEGLTGKEWLDDIGGGHEVWPKDLGRPYGARCGVYRRGQREATYAVVYTEEVQALERVDVVVRDRGKDVTRHEWRLAKRWQDGHGVLNMVAKCAEAAVLREVFPETCSGLYLAEEVGKLRAEQRAKEATDREAAARARIRERHAAAQQADVPADEPTHETPDDGVVHDGIVLPRDDEPTRGEQAARLRERVQARATERAQAAADAPQPEPDAPNDPPAEEVPEEVPAAPAVPLPSTPEECTQCLREEISEMAQILGVDLEEFTKRLRGGLGGADQKRLLRFVGMQRPTVIAELRRQDRHDEARAYSEADPDFVAPVEFLLGRAVVAD
jgi:hypothetical protein